MSRLRLFWRRQILGYRYCSHCWDYTDCWRRPN